MFENTITQPQNIIDNQSDKDFISSQLEKYFLEKEIKFQALEKKILSDLQSIEGLKYDFVDMLKYGKIKKILI